MVVLHFLVILLVIIVHDCESGRNPSRVQWPVVKPSLGQVWPKPQFHVSSNYVFTITPQSFSFFNTGRKCRILEEAFVRYNDLIFNPPRKAILKSPTYKSFIHISVSGNVKYLNVTLNGKCEEWPYHGMDEKYKLNIDSNGNAVLMAKSIWGLLRGLETFSQLIYHFKDGKYYINSTHISDFPRFPFRGLMLDTSRHFVPVKYILQNLDAMAQCKYNVFHWHIVDDDSFPYKSQRFPDIANKGAFHPSTHVYSMADIVNVINYSRLRGIRVIVEYDTPGHSQSWGPGQPGLLTPCYANISGQQVIISYGPVNPVSNMTYNFLGRFFAEIAKLFPDQYLHLGGDEVEFSCWESNPDVTDFMTKMGFGKDYKKLENYYMTRLINTIGQFGRKYIVWQEVFDNGVNLKKDAVVHIWKNNPKPMDEMYAVTKAGYRAILSECWYLSDFTMGNDWIKFYPCEPMNFNGTSTQMKLVIGGETCLWGEYVDATNMMSRLWPRALAPAERLWSNRAVNNSQAAAPRFEEHRCRMVERGINAEPVNGPSFCPSDHLI